jgi:hypothetical protein
LTIVNVGSQDFTGPISVVFTKFPRGVSLANGTVSSGTTGGGIFGGGSEPAGLLFVVANGDLIKGGAALRVFVRFTNPFRANLSSFFRGPDYGLQFFQGALV